MGFGAVAGGIGGAVMGAIAGAITQAYTGSPVLLSLPTLTILTSGRCSLPADHSFLLTIDTLHHSIVHITHLAVGKCGSPNFIKYLGPVDPNWTREKPDTKHAKKTVRKKPTIGATCLLCNSCTYIINQNVQNNKKKISVNLECTIISKQHCP